MGEFLYGLRYFVVRFVVALLFLLAIHNPTDWCFTHWLLAEPRGAQAPAKALVGVLLICGLVYMAVTTHKTMGKVGLALAVLVIGLSAWEVYANVGVIWTQSRAIIGTQVCLAFLFAFGMSAANLNRRLSGQVTTNQAGPVHTVDGHHGG